MTWNLTFHFYANIIVFLVDGKAIGELAATGCPHLSFRTLSDSRDRQTACYWWARIWWRNNSFWRGSPQNTENSASSDYFWRNQCSIEFHRASVSECWVFARSHFRVEFMVHLPVWYLLNFSLIKSYRLF